MAALDGEILGPGAGAGKDQERSVRRNFWRTLARAADRVPFMEDLVAAYYTAFDPETPTRVRMTLMGALAYFVLPLDTIPDVLALVGFSDDIAVLTLAISTVRSHMTDAHRRAARRAIEAMKAGDTPESAA
jgi:Uncharacterized conserved protein